MNTFKATALFLGLAMSASAFGMKGKENFQKYTKMTVEDALRRLTPKIEITPAQEDAAQQEEFAKELDIYLLTLPSPQPSRPVSPTMTRVRKTDTISTDGKAIALIRPFKTIEPI